MYITIHKSLESFWLHKKICRQLKGANLFNTSKRNLDCLHRQDLGNKQQMSTEQKFIDSCLVQPIVYKLVCIF